MKTFSHFVQLIRGRKILLLNYHLSKKKGQSTLFFGENELKSNVESLGMYI